MIGVDGWWFLFSLHEEGGQTQEEWQSFEEHLADFPVLLPPKSKIKVKKLDIVYDNNWNGAKANALGILPAYIQISSRWCQFHWVFTQILILTIYSAQSPM